MNQSPDNPDDQALRLIGCRVNANGVVTVVTWHPDVTAVLKTKRWAAFIQDDGWQFPEQYLDHVARLMLGAGIRLYRIDGTPIATDADIADQPARDHTAAVNADIAAAKANALDPEAAHAAYLDAIAEIRRHTPRRPQPGPRSSDWNQPSSYELTPAELRREIERCIAAGWQPWEIATRFVDPDTAPEPTR
jgi:hypothetical protein